MTGMSKHGTFFFLTWMNKVLLIKLLPSIMELNQENYKKSRKSGKIIVHAQKPTEVFGSLQDASHWG